MNKVFFFALLMLASISSLELQSQTYLTVRGIVIDQSTQSPIPFAHIGIPSQGIGTVTNDQGTFSFNFPATSQEAPIEISHIGHYKTTFTYDQWPTPDSVIIELRSHAIVLQGVEVLEAEYPLSFYVQKAIKNLNKNYKLPSGPTINIS